MIKILVADDDLTMVSLLKTLLGMEGYHVETLFDQQGDILENIVKYDPDYFLVDIFLGEINGLDLVKTIRRMPELKHCKIIMASGVDKAFDCMNAGADGFLLKPYMPDELFIMLHSLGSPVNA